MKAVLFQYHQNLHLLEISKNLHCPVLLRACAVMPELEDAVLQAEEAAAKEPSDAKNSEAWKVQRGYRALPSRFSVFGVLCLLVISP